MCRRLKQVVEIVFVARFGLWFGLRLGFGVGLDSGTLAFAGLFYRLCGRFAVCGFVCYRLAVCFEVCFERQGCCCRIVCFLICRLQRVCFQCVCCGVQWSGRFLHFFRFFRLFSSCGTTGFRRRFCVAVFGRLNGFRSRLRRWGAKLNACVGLFGRTFFGYVGFAGV